MEQAELYAKMYYTLVCAAADAIDFIESGCITQARERLIAALNEAEDLYIEDVDSGMFPSVRELTPEDRRMLHALRAEMAEEYRQDNHSSE